MLSRISKPIHRGPLRMWLGKRYFILKRWFQWYFKNNNFAKTLQKEQLPHLIFEHQTPLLRRLKNLDMHLQYNKVDNLKIASKKMNGLIIHPGETFSFWYLVGQTTKAKGYKRGMMLRNGKIVPGIGGGLCQMSNLIFWMLMHSPLTIKERWRHSFDVFPDANRTQPFGSGATISYNYVDLQFKNETDSPFQLNLWLSEENLHGSFRSNQPLKFTYEVEERNHQFVQEPWGGYSRHNQIFKLQYDSSGNLLKEEPIVENHAILMYRPFLGGETKD